MTDVAADESVEEEIEGDGEEGADQTEGQAGSRFSMPMGMSMPSTVWL